uniref:uncharacterized protein LOC122598798 isoform X1 n=1 Tax=Erigeron canadensis TaxID=72917 RepID=UPI001CB9089F|nr:uncharacterized protein LOC122598798 isoform X1 [Erigeron canadensis]
MMSFSMVWNIFRTLNYPMAWHKRCGRGSPACYTFGQDIASQFNHMNGLVLISRSRQNCHGGFQLVPVLFCLRTIVMGKCPRKFTASNDLYGNNKFVGIAFTQPCGMDYGVWTWKVLVKSYFNG